MKLLTGKTMGLAAAAVILAAPFLVSALICPGGICVIGPPEPPPMPTAPPGPEYPVLIVPGLGASYNREVMLKDQESGGSWDFAPSVDWFESLIERLEEEGYDQGRDIFIAHYDWRLTNKESAQKYLKPAIDAAKEAMDAEMVDIVAHSMGGLVARSYIQGDNYEGDVGKLILLGTPNEGAADAYVSWEGGLFPERWSRGSRLWVGRIERSLKKVRDFKEKRPITFREFFPSLHELVPTTGFASRLGAEIGIRDPNLWLKNLNEDSDVLAEQVNELVTVAGKGKGTLSKIPLDPAGIRTSEDITLERWRDGHPVPDPPQLDSSWGDQTVLASSVHAVNPNIYSQYNINGAVHDKLPGLAQEIVSERLVENPKGDFVPVYLAQASLGVDVMSPVMPVIYGPGGRVLSMEGNEGFEDAVFDWDPADPEGIKMLTIVDPPPGEYRIELTGNNDGGFTVVTSYADEDETVFSSREGTTRAGEVDELFVTVGEDTTSLIDDGDIAGLLEELGRLNDIAYAEVVISRKTHQSISREAVQASKFWEKYQEKRDSSQGKSDMAMLMVFRMRLDNLEREAGRSGNEDLVEQFGIIIQTIRDNTDF